MTLLEKVFNSFPAKKEKRSSGPTTLKAPSTWLLDILGITADTVVVNNDSAMTHAAVWSCIKVLSETIAALPVHVYKKTDNGREISNSHPVDLLISREPSEYQTSFTFRESMQTQLCLNGNAYAYIERNGGNQPIALHYLPFGDVTVKKYKKGLIYNVNGVGALTADEVLHIPALTFDGLLGLSPITAARENIELGLSAQKFGNNFFRNGANLNGYISVPEVLDDESYERMKASWDARYSGTGKNSQTAILEAGSRYERIGIPPEDAQFLETRKFQVNEIARIFRVPPHMIGDLEKSTFSNIEHQGIEFVTHTITPWLVRWEQEMNRKLFSRDEKQQYYVKFNTNALLRGDATARANYYRTMWHIGAISQNDIRALEEMNDIEGGGRYFVPLNMVPSDKVDETIQPPKPNDLTS
jgi:HK97 family phage portal protein